MTRSAASCSFLSGEEYAVHSWIARARDQPLAVRGLHLKLYERLGDGFLRIMRFDFAQVTSAGAADLRDALPHKLLC